MRAPTWREPAPRQADFYAGKGVLSALLSALGLGWSIRSEPLPFLHPGRSAVIRIEGTDAGWLGELHPTLAAERDLAGTLVVFEIDLDVLPTPAPVPYDDVTSFPEVREDLAVVVDEQISAARVLVEIQAAGTPLLASAEVFDVYRDPEKLGEGKVSLAVRLVFRASDRTLTDEETARQRQTITTALEENLGGRIRDN